MLKNIFAGVAAFAASLLIIGCGTDAPQVSNLSADASNGQDTTVTAGPKPDGTPCATNLDCMGGNVCADEASWCVSGACESRPGQQKISHAGLACDDGNLCTTGDTCAAGKCSGKIVDCDDKTTCTNDSCDAKLGCQHSVQSGVLCSDGDACTSGDKCSAGGTCAGDKLDCDDKNLCTTDSCDPAKGCVSIPNANPCDDGNVCTEGDLCAAGACAAGSLKNCDDGKQCIDDSCDPIKGCTHAASKVGQLCNDDNAKTVGDMCDGSGQCVGKTATTCAVDADCLGLEVNKCATYVCDAGLGLCKPQPTALTDDNNPCTLESCNAATGLTTHTPLEASCDDGNICTVGDLCKKGVCTAGAAKMACDDADACTTDSCDPLAGGCAHTAVVCDDKNVYTDDSCAPKYGCQFVAQKVQVTCEIPSDFMTGFVFNGCSLTTKFGKISSTGMKSYASVQIGDGIEIPLENVCAALAGGAVLIVNATAYMDDGTPIGAGGSVTSVTAPGGTKVPGKLQIWSADDPDRVISAEDMKKWCK